MASSPFLATFALPLILEKLSSTLRTAKHDALSALSLCCAAYGRDVLTRLPPDSDQHASSHSPYGHSSPHDKKATLLSRVWSGLRSELLSPCDPEIFSTTGALGAVSEELSSRLETAGHAYSCLSSCLDSLGDALIPLVVQDGSIGGWMKNALEDRSESQGGKGSPSASARFSCVASILSAVSSTSPEGLGAISSQFLPLVLNSISPSALLSTRVDESLASPMRGLQFIGLMTKNLSSCNGNKLESMRAGLQDLICRTSQALDVFGGQLDQAMQPIPDTDGDLLSFEAILQEATLIYCFAWSNLLSLADRLFPSKSSDEGQNAPRDLLPPSVAHRLTTRLAKWALSPPQSSSPVSVSPDPKLFVSFGSLVPPLDPKIHSKGLPSDLVRSQAAAIASPPSALPLQQAALDALLALLSSSLSLGGGCLTLTDRVLDQVISLLVNSASSANQDWAHRSRSHLLMAASALSHDARLPDLGWALMGRWRDLALGPLSLNHPGLNATDGQDTLMTSGETGAATHQLGLSRELLQCMASSILPGLLSSLPSNVATIDEWKLKSAASFALSLLDSLSSLDVSSAPAGIKEIFLVAASFVGQCVAIAGRSASPAEVLGTLAIKAIQGITKPMTLHSEHFLLSPSLCAIITSLPPSLLSSFLMDPDLKSNLLTQLVKPALEASGSLPAAVALASLVIKSPDSEIGSLSSFIVESFQSLSNKDGLGFSAEAWRALSWLCRALVMRKHEASLLLIDLAISTIFSQDNSNNQLGSTKEASALMFRLLVSEASPHTQENEDIQSREIREEEMAMQMLSPYGRPLWRQRAFDLSLGRLEKAQNSNLSTDQCYISLALCHLIGACAKSQPRLLMGSASIAGRSLTLSLQYLTTPSNSQESPSSLSDALTGALDALDALLGINEEITQTSNAPSPWPEASPHLPSLLAALTCLVAFNGFRE